MSDLDIRIANAADAPTIAEIYRPHVVSGTATFELTPPDAGEIAARIKRVTGEGYPYFVAASGGQIAGYAYAASFRARPAFRWTVEDSIYIASTHQGRGLGKRLLQALIKASTAANFRQMVAVIGNSPRQGASIALHRACGFKETGRMPSVGFKHGEWLDLVMMQRALGPGDRAPPA